MLNRAWIHLSWLVYYPYNRAIGWTHKDLINLLHIAKRIG